MNKQHWGGKSCRKYLGNDVTITIYRLVPGYVVGTVVDKQAHLI